MARIALRMDSYGNRKYASHIRCGCDYPAADSIAFHTTKTHQLKKLFIMEEKKTYQTNNEPCKCGSKQPNKPENHDWNKDKNDFKEEFKNGAKKAGEGIRDAAYAAKDATKEGLEKAGDRIKETGMKVKDTVQENVTHAAHKVKEVATEAGDRIKEKIHR